MGSCSVQHSPTTLLWTGGWDSTFRLCQLLLVERRPVITHYIIDLWRPSTLKELDAMATIRQELIKRIDDESLFPPTNIYLQSDFPKYPDILRAYANIRLATPIGKQHEWLACYARFLGIADVELSLHWINPVPPVYTHIFDGLDPENRKAATVRQSSDVQTLFQRFSFPVLRITKSEMGDFAREHDYQDILYLTWFCHKPIRGRPCGMCKPCKISVHQERKIQYARLAKIRDKSWRLLRALRTLPQRLGSQLSQPDRP